MSKPGEPPIRVEQYRNKSGIGLYVVGMTDVVRTIRGLSDRQNKAIRDSAYLHQTGSRSSGAIQFIGTNAFLYGSVDVETVADLMYTGKIERLCGKENMGAVPSTAEEEPFRHIQINGCCELKELAKLIVEGVSKTVADTVVENVVEGYLDKRVDLLNIPPGFPGATFSFRGKSYDEEGLRRELGRLKRLKHMDTFATGGVIHTPPLPQLGDKLVSKSCPYFMHDKAIKGFNYSEEDMAPFIEEELIDLDKARELRDRLPVTPKGKGAITGLLPTGTFDKARYKAFADFANTPTFEVELKSEVTYAATREEIQNMINQARRDGRQDVRLYAYTEHMGKTPCVVGETKQEQRLQLETDEADLIELALHSYRMTQSGGVLHCFGDKAYVYGAVPTEPLNRLIDAGRITVVYGPVARAGQISVIVQAPFPHVSIGASCSVITFQQLSHQLNQRMDMGYSEGTPTELQTDPNAEPECKCPKLGVGHIVDCEWMAWKKKK